jgi:hypothetical protein
MLALTGALILSGCNSINSASFREMSSAYRDVAAGYANDNVLLNIVRASRRMPVTFLEIPSVMGTGSTSAGGALGASVNSLNPNSVPGFFSAAAGSYYGPSASLSVNDSFTFTQSSLDNSSFMNAFLADIKVDTVASLSNNVVAPTTVLYSLVIDSIEVRNQKNEIVSLIENNPNLPNYADDFQKALYTLVESGLSTQQVTNKMVLSPPMDAHTLNNQFGVLASAFTQPGFMIETIKKPGARDMYQAVRVVPVMQFCFNKQLSSKVIGHVFSDSAYCANVGIENNLALGKQIRVPGATTTDQGKVSLFIKLRSTRTVFDYLGRLVDLQNQNPPRLITIKSPDQTSTSTAGTTSMVSYPIFVVEKNSGVKSISSINLEGDTYSMPRDSKSYTRDVLVTLSQLLTLNKVPGSIPASPSVLVK